MIEVFYTKIDIETFDAAYQKDIDNFPSKLKEKILAYRSVKHQLHDYFGKKLLQYLLKEKQLKYSLSDLKYTEKDRPYFDCSTFDFNISHSGKYVVLVCSDTSKVGVDIEQHRAIQVDDFKRYFSEDEWQNILQSTIPQNQFFDYWTIKEAAIKCLGDGVAVLSKTKTLDENRVLCDDEIFYYKKLDIENNYSFALCSSEEISEIKIKALVLQ